MKNVWFELWISRSGLKLTCPGGQPHPCYTEFAPSPLCPYLPAAQFIPLQGTYSVKVSGALLYNWLSVLEIGILSFFFFWKKKCHKWFILISLPQILVSIWITRTCVPHLAAVWLLSSVHNFFISPTVKVSSLSFQYWLLLILIAMKSIVSLWATAAPSIPCPPPMVEDTLTKTMDFYHLPAIGLMSYIEC